MKTLKQYAGELYKFKDQPTKLSPIYIELGSRYSYLAEDLKGLRVERARFWEANKYEDGKVLSDRKLEMKWLLTESGKRLDDIVIDMNAVKELMSAIKTISIISHHEIRNEV